MRAYVNFPYIETITVADHLREDKQRKVHGYNFKVTVENAGNTPAIDCIVYSDHSFVDVEGFQSPAFNKTKGGRVPTAIGPHSMIYGQSPNISREDAQRVLEGKARLFLWRRAEYSDVFDRSPNRFVEKSWEVLIPVNPAVIEPGDPLPAFSFMAFGREIHN